MTRVCTSSNTYTHPDVPTDLPTSACLSIRVIISVLLFQLVYVCGTKWTVDQKAADESNPTHAAPRPTRTKMAAGARLTGTGTPNMTKIMRARDLARAADSSEPFVALSVCCFQLFVLFYIIQGWFVLDLKLNYSLW